MVFEACIFSSSCYQIGISFELRSFTSFLSFPQWDYAPGANFHLKHTKNEELLIYSNLLLLPNTQKEKKLENSTQKTRCPFQVIRLHLLLVMVYSRVVRARQPRVWGSWVQIPKLALEAGDQTSWGRELCYGQIASNLVISGCASDSR